MGRTKFGFSGTRRGLSEGQKAALKAIFSERHGCEFHHGDCIGADADAHEIAEEAGMKIIIHPPEKSAYRAFCKNFAEIKEPDDYLPRNRDIVDDSTVLIVAPESLVEAMRSGTWYTTRHARMKRKPIIVLHP